MAGAAHRGELPRCDDGAGCGPADADADADANANANANANATGVAEQSGRDRKRIDGRL